MIFKILGRKLYLSNFSKNVTYIYIQFKKDKLKFFNIHQINSKLIIDNNKKIRK
jgi:hypothetical protein